MKQIVLIRITGDDQPGLTASLMRILASHPVNILDMGQAVIHRSLALGVMVEIPLEDSSAEAVSSPVLIEVREHLQSQGLNVQFDPVSAGAYQEWVEAHGKPKYIVTLLARRGTAQHIGQLAEVTRQHGLNIQDVQRLSGRVSLSAPAHSRSTSCFEFTVRGEVDDKPALHRKFLELASELDVDIAFQEDSIFRRNRRLVCFDMDSTLIEGEVIDELARIAGVGEEVAALTAQAMHGELDFQASLKQRVKLLAGLPEQRMADVIDNLPITEGAERLVRSLQRVGYRTAILSGGFAFFAEHLRKKLGIDYMYANQLEIVDGKVSGNVIGDIVDGERKASLLGELAARERISLEQVIAVGDGANDLPMLSAAGLGIAFRAKPLVQRRAEHSISTLGLDGILYLLGFSDNQSVDEERS